MIDTHSLTTIEQLALDALASERQAVANYANAVLFGPLNARVDAVHHAIEERMGLAPGTIGTTHRIVGQSVQALPEEGYIDHG